MHAPLLSKILLFLVKKSLFICSSGNTPNAVKKLRNKVSGKDFLQSFSETELNRTLELGPVQIRSNSMVLKGDTKTCKVQCIIYKKVSNVESNLYQVTNEV